MAMSAADTALPTRRRASGRRRAVPASGPAAGADASLGGIQVGTVAGPARVPLLPALLFIAVCTPLLFAFGPVAMTAHRAVLLLAIIPILLRYASGAAGALRWIDVGVAFYAFWAVLTIAYWHGGPKALEFGGSASLEVIGGYLFGRVCIRNAGQFLKFSKFFVVLVLATLPLALIESQTGTSILLRFYNSLPIFNSLPEVHTLPRLGLERVQMTFPTPIHYGLFGAVCFSLGVVGTTNCWSLSTRIAVGVGIFLCSFLSLSSGAFLALLLQLGLLIWATMMSGARLRWRILFIICLTFYTVIEVLSDRSGIQVFLAYATFSPTTAFYRTRIFDYGMDNVWANPLFGIGLNDWVRPSWMVVRSVDNFWLLTTMRHGLPGFLPLAVAWIALMWKISRLKIPEGSDLFWIRRGYMFMMLGLTFSLCTVHIWGAVYSLVFCLMGMGVWLLDARIDDGTDPAAAGTAPPPDAAPTPAAASRQPPTYTRFPGPRGGSGRSPRSNGR
jgi:hypothetical protein